MNFRDAIMGGLILVIAFLVVTRHPEDAAPPLMVGCKWPPDSMDEELRWNCVTSAAARGCALGSTEACQLERYMRLYEEDERSRFAAEHSVWLFTEGDSDVPQR